MPAHSHPTLPPLTGDAPARVTLLCSFCRQSITQDAEGHIRWDAKWLRGYGWLCYYCHTGVTLPQEDRA
jgi:hypothetical protein